MAPSALCMQRSCSSFSTASSRAPARRSSRTTVVRVQAFANDSTNGKQSMEDMNRLIGRNIADAASHIGTMHVWQANAAIGKFVKKAAEDAKAGKLKLKGSTKGSSTASSSSSPAAKK